MGPSLLAHGCSRVVPPKFVRARAHRKISCKLTGAFLTLGLAGCVSYAPAPEPTGEVANQFTGKTVLWSTAVQGCKRLAPTAPCDVNRPDRLLLFAILIDNNPDVFVARAHLRSVEAAAAAARSPAGPTLTLSSEYARASSDPSPWLLGAALDFPIDRGGRRAARIASADLSVDAAQYDLVEAIWTARMVLVRALDQISNGTRQLALTGQLVALQERRMQAMTRRVNSGESSRADLERSRGELADARRREAAAMAMHETSKVQVAKALGFSVSNLPDGLFDGDTIAAEDPASLPTEYQRSQALLARADLLKAMVMYDQSEADLRGEIAKQYPAISVGPGFTWERGLIKLPFNIGLVLPPLDLNRRNIRAAEARRSEAGSVLEATYASAANSVDAAYAETIAARQALNNLRNLELPIARRLAEQADREISAGAIDRTDWAAAKAGHLVVEIAELEAKSRVLAADAQLEDALRRPLSGPETLIEGTTP